MAEVKEKVNYVCNLGVDGVVGGEYIDRIVMMLV